MIKLYILIIFLSYIFWTIYIFKKKKNIVYIYFWIFLTFIFFLLMLMLFIGSSVFSEEKYIKDKKSEYLNYLDLKDTKLYINNEYIKDNKEAKNFLRNFKPDTRFTGDNEEIGNVNIEIIGNSNKSRVVFFVEKEKNLCYLYVEKSQNHYIYLGTKEAYCNELIKFIN